MTTTRWTIQDLLEGCQGTLEGCVPQESACAGFSIDTRSLRVNDLFFALSGPNSDGHHFVLDALKKGCRGAVVSRTAFEAQKNEWLADQTTHFFICVAEPLQALQRLAKWHRQRFKLPLVGITGSNGKTTAKEMTATILGKRGPVLKTEGNFNNHIGLPLTLLRLSEEHQSAVIEMGISHFGDMATLCDIAQPTIGLITNIGPAHLEGLENLKGVAREKGLLFEGLQKIGTCIINQDDPLLKDWTDRVATQWTYGLHTETEPYDFSADHIKSESETTTFILHQHRSGESAHVTLPTPGRHHVSNALGAASIAAALGIPIEQIAEGLSDFQPLSQRTQILKTKGITLIFDAYNANPASVEAALDLLAEHPQNTGKRIALLADMLQLGDTSEEAHYTIGLSVATHGIDALIALGQYAETLASGARAGGLTESAISVHPDFRHLQTTLNEGLQSGDILLVKGSRGMKLERVLPLLGLHETGLGEGT